jgi:hypothetical protein
VGGHSNERSRGSWTILRTLHDVRLLETVQTSLRFFERVFNYTQFIDLADDWFFQPSFASINEG